MPHEFHQWEHEPETQPASSRRGGPPGTLVGVDILDPLQPPARPSKTSLLVRILAVALLLALAGALSLLLTRR